MKELQQYTYTIPAGGSVQIPATNDNFYVQASTGPVAVRGNTFGRLRGMVAGMGLKGVPFDRLEMFDESGAPNTVSLMMTPAEFVNNTFSGSVVVVGPQSLDAATINALVRPEQATGNWNSAAVLAASTPLTVFAPGANVNGAVIWAAEAQDNVAAACVQCFIAKASAPASVIDGEIIASSIYTVSAGGTNVPGIRMATPQRIAPGLGLYFISSLAGGATNLRHARFSLL